MIFMHLNAASTVRSERVAAERTVHVILKA